MVLSDKVVKTRKPHRCTACLRTFPAGSIMKRQVHTEDYFQTWNECQTCMQILSRHYTYFADNHCDNVEEGCVKDALEKDQTPEQLLKYLDNVNNY